MRRIDRHLGEPIRIRRVGHAVAGGPGLEFAIAVRHAHRTDMVAFGQQKLQQHLAVFGQAIRIGHHDHAFLDRRRAGGQQACDAADFDQAQTAGTHAAQTVEMTERGNEPVILTGDVQHRLAGPGSHILAINLQFDGGHDPTSFRVPTLFAPSHHFSHASQRIQRLTSRLACSPENPNVTSWKSFARSWAGAFGERFRLPPAASSGATRL